jgi:ABC-2 type transport system permease protein
MNIVLRELRANLKSLIIWSISMALLIYVGMVKYSGIEAVGQSANELVNQLPEAMKIILGMNNLDLTSISGYYGVFFLYFVLLGSTYAIMLGAIIISKEESDKTADFLFVKPISRSKVITAKLIATLINLATFNIVTLFSSIFFVAMFNKGEPINAQIIYLMIALFILQVLFASIGAGISVLTKNTKKATSAATTLLLTMFVLSAAIDMYGKISFLKYLTPFKYFPTAQVMRGSFDPFYLFLSAGILIACLVLTYITFQKRDIHI